MEIHNQCYKIMSHFININYHLSNLLISSLEKTLMLGKIEGKRRRERQRMRCLDSITNSVDMNLSKF